MPSATERIASELDKLLEKGRELLKSISKDGQMEFISGYQSWYTRALVVIRHLLPDREEEFRQYYTRDSKRKAMNVVTFVLQDYLEGLEPGKNSWGAVAFDTHTVAGSKYYNQWLILESARSRLNDLLANIRGVLEANLFDSELEAGRNLLKNGHVRAAGAVAGVVLESHLADVSASHAVSIKRRDPHISDFNDALKDAAVFDIPQWRAIQRLADIRNLCDHKKAREPTADEVEELIAGIDKLVKTTS